MVTLEVFELGHLTRLLNVLKATMRIRTFFFAFTAISFTGVVDTFMRISGDNSHDTVNKARVVTRYRNLIFTMYFIGNFHRSTTVRVSVYIRENMRTEFVVHVKKRRAT